MNKILNSMAIRTLVLLFAASVTFAQTFAQDRVPFRQAELDQMLAPVALYPDSLLSQVLMASTYPLEVVQAARWSRANPGLKGQDAVRAVERVDWDPSVKSLAAFPQILAMMDEKFDWTERLGEAFLAQQADVMDSVQGLRRRAEAAGNLRSSEQMRVAREGEVITIRQPAPEIVYVPYYNPVVVYGPWWWPAYPPVYWGPPAYYVVHPHRPGFFWGPGIVISANFFFGRPDWHQRHVTVVHNYITHVTVNRNVVATNVRPVAWQHDSRHRRDAPFRNPEARQRFEEIRAASADTRRGADRRDAAPERREDRRDAVQERREDKRVKPAAQTETRTTQPDTRRAQPETRSAQPETRSVQPDTRNAQPDRNARPERSERSAPQANDRRGEDRHGERERRDAQRPQMRSANPQPAVVAPIVRSEPRPAAPAVNTQAAPRAVASKPESRPVASAPNPAPRAEHNNPRGNGGGRDHDKDNQRERSAHRDNDRKS